MSVSVVGFDIGSLNSYVVVARQGGVETVANEYSDRCNPTFLSFNEKSRFIGHEAKQQLVTNIPNTLFNFTHFLGKKFNDRKVQEEAARVPYKVVELEDNRIGFEINYLSEVCIVTPEQALAMQLTKLKEVAEINLNTKVVDVVINIPNCSTDSERRAVFDAAQIAGLNCIKIINDSTAIAIAYGLYAQDLPEPEQKPKNVIFVDMGYTHLQANCVAFNKGKMKVVASSHGFIGGRDFDRIIYEHAKNEFKDRYKLNVKDNTKAAVRLLQESEKLKKLMSANSTEIPMNIECFMNDVDVSMRMKRENFEEMSSELLSNVKNTLNSMISEAKLNLDDIAAVELVGGSTRIPSVKQIITELFKKDSRTSLNADEAVARGCALQCAIISPAFKVKDFSITDACSYSISLSYNDGEKNESIEVYPKWHSFPSSKQLTFYRVGDFSVHAHYTSPKDLPNDNVVLGEFRVVNVKPQSNGEAAKIKVKLRLNANGIFTVSQAQAVEVVEKQVEMEVEEKDEKKTTGEAPAEQMDVEGGVSSSAENSETINGDVNMSSEKQSEANNTPSNGEKKEKKKVKKMVTKNVTNHTDLPVQAAILQYNQQKINEFNEKENQMIMQVRHEKERSSAKNSVEEYVYDMRNKLYGDFEPFITESDREVFSAELSKAEDWLYEDGEDESKQVYIDRLNHLKSFGDLVVNRAREHLNRQPAIDEFSRVAMHIQKVISSYQAKDEAYNHLEPAEIETLTKALTDKQIWFAQEINKQKDLPLTQDPVVSVSSIVQQKQELEKIAVPIVNKPKPVATPPTTAEKNPSPEAKSEKPAADTTNNNETVPQGDNTTKPANDMDLD